MTYVGQCSPRCLTDESIVASLYVFAFDHRHSEMISVCFRSGGLQPVHLPPPAGVHGYGPGVHIPTVRAGGLREGVHRQADEPVQVLRVRLLRQPELRAGGHLRHERIPNRYQKAESATEALQRRIQAVLELLVRAREHDHLHTTITTTTTTTNHHHRDHGHDQQQARARRRTSAAVVAVAEDETKKMMSRAEVVDGRRGAGGRARPDPRTFLRNADARAKDCEIFLLVKC